MQPTRPDRRLPTVLLLALLPLGVGGLYAARAQGQGGVWPGPPRPLWPRPLPPIWLPPIQQTLAIEAVHVRATVQGGVARTEVEQLWRNPTDRAQEGAYLFPLPEGATVSEFALYDGDRKLAGRLLDAGQAADTYEGIVRRERDPALLRYVGRGAYEVKLYPVPAHGTRRITLRYAQPLPPAGGDARQYVYSFGGATLGGDRAAAPRETTVQVTLADDAPLANIYSPTHDVRIRRTGDRTAVVTWEAKEARVPDDFLLYYGTARRDPVGLGLLAYNVSLPRPRPAAFTPGGGDGVGGGKRDSGYFLLMAAPRLAAPDAPSPPKRVVLVLDRSGSMAGPKIEQARGALAFVLRSLRPADEFNVLTFNEGNDLLSPRLLRATPDNIARALAFVKDIEAEGGTDIGDALHAALTLFPSASPPAPNPGGAGLRGAAEDGGAAQNMTIFLTDGLPTVGETDDARITARARALARARHVRLFDFGVGYDVDVHFLDRLAQAGRGDSDYVRPEEDIEAKVSRFYRKVASPVLTDVGLTLSGVRVADVYPRPDELPDLFTGSQLLIAGRYAGSGPVTARLTGRVNGRPVSYALAATLPALADRDDFLPRLWATRKIGYLLDAIRLRQSDREGGGAGEDDPALVREITRLSKEYGVLTPYTSFLVTDGSEEPPVPGPVFDGAVPLGGGFGGGITRRGAGGAFAAPPALALPSAPGVARVFATPSGAMATTQSQTLRAAKSAAVASGLAGYDAAEAKAVGARVRVLGAKTFLLQGGVWTDTAYDAAKHPPVVTVQALSDAHFALLRAIPGLAAYTSLGDVLVVLDNGKALRVSRTAGVKTLSAAEVRALR